MSWFAGKNLGKKISVCVCVCVCVHAIYLHLVESFDNPPYCHNNIIDRGISPFGFLRSLGGFHKSYFRQLASL